MSFFERLGSGVTEAGNNISQKARDLSEQNRLNGEITKRESRRRECFTVLGEMYFLSLKEGTAPDFSTLVEEVKTIEEELRQLNQELRKLKKVAVCPNCGTETASGGMFCPKCGAELIRENVCSNCGAPLDADAKFCVRCGSRVAG